MYGDYGGRSSGLAENIRRFFLRGGTPITLGLMIANGITFFLLLTGAQNFLLQYVAFNTGSWPRLFWTFLTWPVLGLHDPLGLLFSLGWVYTFGGSLERSWGTRVYGACVVAVTAIISMAMWLGSLLPMVGNGGLQGLWVLGGAMTVAWALTNRSEVMNFFGLPLPTPVLIMVGCGITWFYGGIPWHGVFALSGCAAAWWYATQGRYGSYPGAGTSRGGQRRPGSGNDKPNLRFQNFERETSDGGRRGFTLARWWRERQEKKRLEAMFRRSGYTDPEERRKK